MTRLTIPLFLAVLLVLGGAAAVAPAAAPAAGPEHLAVLGRAITGEPHAVAASGGTAVAGVGRRLAVLRAAFNALAPIGWTGAFSSTVVDVTLAGSLAVVATGPGGVHLVDTARQQAPAVTAGIPIDATRVDVVGRLLYSAGGDALWVHDVTTRTAPVLLGQAAVASRGMDVEGTHAYLAAGPAGLLVYDVSEPARPREVGRLDTPGEALDVRVSGSTAIVADGVAGVRIVNVSDPAAPTEVSSISLAGCTGGSGPESCPSAARIDLSGTHALVAYSRCASPFDCRTAGGLRVIDVSRPAAPTEVRWLATTSQPRDVAATRDGVLLATTGLWWYAGVSPCWPARGGLLMLDEQLSQDAAWHAIGSAAAVAMDDKTALVVDPVRVELAAVDISRPSSPVPGTIPDGGVRLGVPRGSYGPTDVAVGGEVWSTTGASGAAWSKAPWPPGTAGRGADVEAPTGALRCAPSPTGGSAVGLAALAPGGDRGEASRADRSGPADGRPAAPANGCAPPTPQEWFKRVRVASGRGYALDSTGALRIVGRDGRDIGSVAGPSAFEELAVERFLAFAVTAEGDVRLVDVTDPARPTLGATIPGPAVRVSARHGRLYVAAGESGLRIFDVLEATAPRQLSTVDTPGFAMDVVYGDGYAYVADGPGGVLVYDVRVPSAPVLAAYADKVGLVRRVAPGMGSLVAASDDALLVLHPPEPLRAESDAIFLPLVSRHHAMD